MPGYPCPPAWNRPASPFDPVWLPDWNAWLPNYSKEAWDASLPFYYNPFEKVVYIPPRWPYPPGRCIPFWFPTPILPPIDWNPPTNQNEAIYLGSGTAEVDGAGSVCAVPVESALLAATGQTGFHLPMPATSFGHGGWTYLTSPTPGGTWLSKLHSWDRIQIVRVRSRGRGTPIENYQNRNEPQPDVEYLLYDADGTASRFFYRNGRFEPAFGVHAQLRRSGDVFVVQGGPPGAINQKGAWLYFFTGMDLVEDDQPNQPWGRGDKALVLAIRDPLGNRWCRVDDPSWNLPSGSICWEAPNLTLMRFDPDGKVYYSENSDSPNWQLLGRIEPLLLGSGHPINQQVNLVWYEPEGKHVAFQWWGGVTGNTQQSILSEMQLDTGFVQNGYFTSQITQRWFFEKPTQGKEAQLYQYLYGESFTNPAYLGRLWKEQRGGRHATHLEHSYLPGQAAHETKLYREQLPAEVKTFLVHRWDSHSDKFTELEIRRPQLKQNDSNLIQHEKEVVRFSFQNGKPVERLFYPYAGSNTPSWVERYEYNYLANPDVLTTLVDRQGGRYQWVYEERIAQWWNPEQPATETVLTQSSDPTGVSLQLHYEQIWRDFDVERRLPNPPILPSSVQLGSNPDRRWRFQYTYSASPTPPAPNGLLLGFAEPERRWWKFFYTPASFRQPFQLSLVLDPTGRIMQITNWDSLGRPTRIETYPNRDYMRPLYQETEYTRFGQVRRIRWGYANYNPQQVEYHWEGLQLTGFTDARGRTVRFEYVPGSGELHRIWIGTNLYAQLGYDWYGRLGRVAGGNNVGVNYGYGYRDELISIQHDGDTNAERFYYSCCGQVGRWVRQDGREVWFDYTPNGWLQEAYIPTPTGRQRLAYYEYDLAGRLIFAQSPDAQYTFTYDTTDADRTGWLESSTAQFNTGTNSFTYTFHYDYYLNGDLRSVRRDGPSAGWWEQNRSSESYTYDDAGRLLTQSYQRSGISLTVRYDYDDAGRLREQKVQIGSTTLLTDIAYADHESVGSIWWFNTYLNNSPIATFRYSYYPDGTVRRAEEQVGGSYQVWHWDYYADGSLQYEHSGALPEGRRDYRYDAGGNLMRLPTTATPPSYEFNQLRRVGSWEFRYTPNGERASETNNPVAGYTGNWHYTYDLWGNLIAAYRNGQLVYEARYDAFGNRVWARTASGGRYYLYEGDTLIAELDTNGQLIAEYVWGLLGPVARVERVSGFPPTYRVQLYVLDGLGHVRALVGQENDVWRVTDVYRYDSWGNLIARVGNTYQPFTWNGAYGYEWVPETGLYHVGAREYDPRTARWLQRDPIDAASGDPNLYRYAGNDPINRVDTDGTDGKEKQSGSVGTTAKQKAEQATQGIPPGAEVCPACGGTGLPCNGVHEKRTTIGLLRGGGAFYVVLYCPECNGLGYRPKGGWEGKDKPDSSIPASGPKANDQEREKIQEIGDKYGCHTCGVKQPRGKGKWIPDHVPPTAICEAADELGAVSPRQQLRPQCPECSNKQGPRAREHKKEIRKWIQPPHSRENPKRCNRHRQRRV